jgi:hypothetical protein
VCSRQTQSSCHIHARHELRTCAGGLKSHIAAGPAEDEPSRLCEDEQEGVPVVEGTPGAEALLQIMMKWVWHVEVDKESLFADLLLA